jgi:putative serine protease PepD
MDEYTPPAVAGPDLGRPWPGFGVPPERSDGSSPDDPIPTGEPHGYRTAYEPHHVPVQPPLPPRRSAGAAKVFIAGVLGALLGGALVAGAAYMALRPADNAAEPAAPTASKTSTVTVVTTASEKAIEDAAAVALPSVVNIAVEYYSGSGQGSGIVLTRDGYILTNYHVIDGGTRVRIRLGTDDYDARVVGGDATYDLAVLKVDKTGLTPAKLGSSEALQVGQSVIAVGSPFGLDKTVTSGIVSALHRSNLIEGSSGVTAYTDLIQTDAAINPGNSGGALAALDGSVVGVNTLIESASAQLGASQSAGIGFAIPIDFAKSIADRIIAGKRVTHPYLGASMITVTAPMARFYGLPVSSGALVQQVLQDSPAAAARLEPGDIIVRFGTHAITSSSDMWQAIETVGANKATQLEYVRGNKSTTVEVTLVDQ